MAAQPTINNQQSAVPKALILTGFGINCEEEMAAAYRLAGGEPTIVHLNEVLHGRVSMHDFDVLNFPGGFSFGDDLGSGVVLANKLRYRQTGADGRTLLDDIRAFVAAGKFVLGICNGFQVLVKLGLLPNLGGGFVPEVTLTHNASNRYENRWVRLKVNPQNPTPFLRGLSTLEVPVRHGEGRLVVPDAATREQLLALGLNCLSYADGDDQETGTYPLNPNGADLNCAGLCDPTGRIFGLMPHPEAYLAGCNHPDWGARGLAYAEGEGLAIFRNIVEWVAHHDSPHPPAPSPAGEGGLASSPNISSSPSSTGTSFLELEASSPSPAGEGAGGWGESLAEESRPHYERRQQRETDLQTSISQNVFTATRQQWGNLKGYSRQMRKEPTPAENELWQVVRGQKLGVAFRRQHAIAGYLVDFVALADKLIIELDGSIHDEPQQAEYDHGRTQKLEELGYQVLRFRNEQVLNDLPTVLQYITSHLQNAS